VFRLLEDLDTNNLIDDLRTLSWEAADILLHYSQILKEVDRSTIIKNNDFINPVTIADLEVNNLILETMQEKYPNIGWKYLSEENAKIDPNKCDIDSDWVWVLDPLDGTKDFIEGTEDYAMHFALNYKNKPYLGVVLIPERDELFIADGSCAWCEKRDKTKIKLNLKESRSLSDMKLVKSKNHDNHVLTKLIDKISFEKVISMGSIGCKIASIIRGDCDIYISLSLPGKTSPKDWDFAAPEIILKAAGGQITNLDNQELIYGEKNFEKKGIIIASNSKQTHKKICSQIKDIILRNDLYTIN